MRVTEKRATPPIVTEKPKPKQAAVTPVRKQHVAAVRTDPRHVLAPR